MAIEKPPERAAASSNSLLPQFGSHFPADQVWAFGNQIQYLLRKLFQRRNAASARLRLGVPALFPALQPSHRRTHTDVRTTRPPRAARFRFHGLDHAHPQVTGI